MLNLHEHLNSPLVFGGVRVAHLFCSMLCFCFVCLHPVSCVPDVACVAGLSILHCPIGFLWRLLIISTTLMFKN